MSNLDYTTPTKSQPADGSLDDYEPLDSNHECYYKANTFYAITINPCDDLQFLKKESIILREQRCREAMLNIVQELNHLNRKCELYIVPELSELFYTNRRNAPPRFHWHGFIRFHTNESLKHFLLIDSVKLISTNQIMLKKIANLKGWLSYCTKQQEIMQSKPIANYSTTMSDILKFIEVDLPEGKK